MDTKFWANTALCMVLGGSVICGLVNSSSALTPKGLFAKDAEPSALMKELQDKVVLDSYSVGELSGHVVKGDFLVSNHSEKDVKNLSVRCEFYGEQTDAGNKGHYLGEGTWILTEMTSAGDTNVYQTSAKRYVNTKTKGISCEITDLQLAKAPFYSLHRASSGGGHGAAAPDDHGAEKQDSAGHGQPAH